MNKSKNTFFVLLLVSATLWVLFECISTLNPMQPCLLLWPLRIWVATFILWSLEDWKFWKVNFKGKHRRTDPNCISHQDMPKLVAGDGGASRRYCKVTQEMETLGSMDHIYVPFSDYLWISWILRPSAMITTLVGGTKQRGLLGIITMKIKERLQLIKPLTATECERKLVNFVLETSLVSWVKTEESSQVAVLEILLRLKTFECS